MKYFQLLALCTLTAAITACGGDSNPAPTAPESGIGAATDQNEATADNGNQARATLTGRFVDASVSGLQYTTDTQSGLTGADGSFDYLQNEAVTFSLGDIVLPAATGGEILTPLDVFGVESIDDPRVLNLLRLLQTLDTDANPDNGITLSDAAIASATGLTVDFASPAFDSQVANLVANGGSINSSLIDAQTAMEHFQETLFAEGLVARPDPATAEAPDNSAEQPTPPASGGNSSSHPLVGTSTQFRNFFHDIGGTLTVLDDRTMQVTNFTYDGGGPSVYFYLGNDGNYSPSGGGELIGPQLNGRTWNGETITLTLPEGRTLDDFNGVSVWCDLFFANFGDAIF